MPVTPGYVANPPPHMPALGAPLPINIDVGRQLFVDAFLLDGCPGGCHTTTVYHDAAYRDEVNPVLAPTELWEGRGGASPKTALDMSLAFASAFSGGLWWDPAAALYKMWYRCGNAQCYATSADGIAWEKPALAGAVVAGTNIVDDKNFDGRSDPETEQCSLYGDCAW